MSERVKEVKLFLTKNDLEEMLRHFKTLDLIENLTLISDLMVEIDNFEND